MNLTQVYMVVFAMQLKGNDKGLEIGLHSREWRLVKVSENNITKTNLMSTKAFCYPRSNEKIVK